MGPDDRDPPYAPAPYPPAPYPPPPNIPYGGYQQQAPGYPQPGHYAPPPYQQTFPTGNVAPQGFLTMYL